MTLPLTAAAIVLTFLAALLAATDPAAFDGLVAAVRAWVEGVA
jgi:hypothetical protein